MRIYLESQSGRSIGIAAAAAAVLVANAGTTAPLASHDALPRAASDVTQDLGDGNIPDIPIFEINSADYPGVFRSPSGIAVAPDGTLYVLDSESNRVQRMTPEGMVIDMWGTGGSAPGMFWRPQSIAVADNGNVYVADTGNDRLQVFNPRGSFIGEIGTAASGATGDSLLRAPEGVAVDAAGDIYVADTGNNAVKRYAPPGTWISTFDIPADEEDRLREPTDLAVGADGLTLYAVDSGSDRLHRYSVAGRFLGHFRPDRPFDPSREDLWVTSVTVGTDGTVFAGSSGKIYHFTSDGLPTGVLDVQVGGSRNIRALAVTSAFSLLAAAAHSNTVSADGAIRPVIGDVDISDLPEYRIMWITNGLGSRSLARAPGQFSRRFTPQSYPPLISAAYGPTGRLFVADNLAGRVQWFDSNGLYLGEVAGLNAQGTSYLDPLGVGAAPDGGAWVVGGSRARVMRVAPDGTSTVPFHTSFSNPFGGSSHPASGIAAGPVDDVYLTSGVTGEVHHYAHDGDRRGTWIPGPREYATCSEYDIIGVACNSQPLAVTVDGRVVRLDGAGQNVSVFDGAGGLLHKWATLTGAGDVMESRQGITVDSNNFAYVSDAGAVSVTRYGLDGSRVGALDWSAIDDGPERLSRPGGIAISPSGVLFVSDRDQGRVVAYANDAPDAWRGEYYASPWLTGQALLIDHTEHVSFIWDKAPVDISDSPGWSARLTRRLELAPDGHAFHVDAAGGVRLWLGDNLIVDAWHSEEVEGSFAFNVPPDGRLWARLEFNGSHRRSDLRAWIDNAVPPTGPPETPTATVTTPTVTVPTPTPGTPGQSLDSKAYLPHLSRASR